MEKAEKERKGEEEQQKAIEEEMILNEKEQLRIQLERMEEGKQGNGPSDGTNDTSEGVSREVVEQGSEDEKRNNHLTEVMLTDHV